MPVLRPSTSMVTMNFLSADLDDDHWEDNFMESLTQQEATPAAQDSDPEDDVDVPPPVPKIKDFKEAVPTLEDVQNFWRVAIV